MKAMTWPSRGVSRGVAVLCVAAVAAACSSDGDGSRDRPEFSSPATAAVAENQTGAYLAVAEERDGDGALQPITYGLADGADVALFSINAQTGAVSFITAPDFERPADADGDNVYDIEVTAVADEATATLAVAITVTDVVEAFNTVGAIRVDGDAFDTDLAGEAVSQAGDVDGDGLADVLVGARNASFLGRAGAGEAYVIFGDTLARATALNDALGDAPGAGGVVLRGAASGDQAGQSVASAGDVDGDGLDDVLVIADDASPNGVPRAGQTYLIFGAAIAAEKTADGVIDLTNVVTDGVGVRLDGQRPFATDMNTVASILQAAGDVDGDGLGDILIGAPTATVGAEPDGLAYLVFGEALASEAAGDRVIALDTIAAGGQGVLITRPTANPQSILGAFVGFSVGGAGDLDGDGADEVFVSAPGETDAAGLSVGAVYIVRGSAIQAARLGGGAVNIDTLAAQGEGFVLQGVTPFGLFGFAVTALDDVTGDNRPEIAVSDVLADPGGVSNSGVVYVFSSDTVTSDFDRVITADLAALRILGAEEEQAGRAIAWAGDVDGDGLGDLAVGSDIGAFTPFAINEGVVSVVFGDALQDALGGEIRLADLTATGQGVVLFGGEDGAQLGYATSTAGDIDGDGFDDVIAGAPFGPRGRAYVASGRAIADERGLDRTADLLAVTGGIATFARTTAAPTLVAPAAAGPADPVDPAEEAVRALRGSGGASAPASSDQ